MTLLADLVSSRLSYSRSVNVERGVATAGVIPAYILTQRTLEALDRIVTAFEADGAPKAWTVTGPYGSGKSAFALFLSGLFAGDRAEPFSATSSVLRSRDPVMANRVHGVRNQLAVADRSGFVIAMATAEREPAAKTIARALLNGATEFRRGPGRPPKVVMELRRLAAASEPDPREVTAAFGELTKWAPVILLLDEFGKNLEYAADDPAIGDLYILQQLAERLAGEDALPGALVTLQHLSFADYAFGLPAERLREWNKVQGRFEDISFLEADDQTAQLIAEALNQDEQPEVREAIDAWADAQISASRDAGVTSGVASDVKLAARCYPIHPVAVDTLAYLTSRYGQHERSLFTMLTSSEPFSLNWYLDRTEWNGEEIPAYGLDLLFDYFVTNVADVPSAASHAARWLEIRTSVIEARTVSESARATLKVIGLLNLLGATGGLRASPGVLRVLRPDADQDIEELLSSGILTYRGFADEYRIWEGSDYDLSTAVASQRDRTRDESISGQVESVLSLSPRVAQRHSLETATMRYFEQRYVEDLPPELEVKNPNADGAVYFVFGRSHSAEPPPDVTSTGKPIVVVYTPDSLRIDEAAREAAAIAQLLADDPELANDRIARREARVRASIAQRTLTRRLQQAFAPGRSDVTWWAQRAIRNVQSDLDVSRLLSDLCDAAYLDAPVVRNEMINRSMLTSQGARARRVLLEAMIENPDEAQFGLAGNGPDVATYRAVLEEGMAVRQSTGAIRMPSPGSTLRPACETIYQGILKAEEPIDLGTIVEELTLPPLGVRRGVIPILLAIVLLAHQDDIAIYQDGSFEPVLAADVFERLIKAPERFTARHVGVDGAFSDVIRALRERLEIPGTDTTTKWRNATLLSILRPVLRDLRRLPEFSMRTRLVSEDTQAVRTVLTEVSEPDRLLFAVLPETLGVDIESSSGPEAYATGLNEALAELRDSYDVHVRQWVKAQLVRALAVPSSDPVSTASMSTSDLREELRVHTRPLRGRIVDRRLKPFLLVAEDSQMADGEWVDAVALNVSKKPPRAWRDDDRVRFTLGLDEIAGTLRRVIALYIHLWDQDHVDGLTAVRVTLTSANAEERDLVVWVDDRARPALEAIAANAKEFAEALPGITGAESLLAVLADRVLARSPVDDSQSTESVQSDESEVGIA